MNYTDHGIFGVNETGREEQRVICPECTPQRKKKNLKDLSVNIAKGTWLCHHCGWSGGLKKEGFKPMQQQKRAYKKPDPIQSFELPQKPIDYFINERKIGADILQMAGVTYESEWMPQTEKKENCIVFNYFLNGELINKKYRDGRKHFRLSKDARLILYAPLAKNNFEYKGDFYLTEGEMDCLTLLELGFENAISCPNGAPPENANLDSVDFSYLDSLDEIFRERKNAYLVMDADKVGSRFRDEIARRIGYERCLKAEYPEDCKDINDVLVKHGKDKAREVVKSCVPYPISGLYSVSDLYGNLIDLYENGFAPSVMTGWDKVDRLYTVRQKEFTIITGIPSHGKSAWLDALIVNIAIRYDWKFGIYSPENYPFERHIAKLCELYIGKPFDRKYSGYMTEDEAEKAFKWCNDHFLFLMPEEMEEQTLDRILALGRSAIFKSGIKGFIIDPWNEIDHHLNGDPETIYISKSLSKIRRFSRVSDVHTFVVAHPTKLQKDKKGNYPVPTPYDIAGSAHFRNKADNCLCVHRDFENNRTMLYSQKIRFKEIGRIGETSLNFDIRNNRYS
jgi:twinkle protein